MRPRHCWWLAAAIAGAASFGPTAGAQIYKWVDDAGATHYGEQPPAGPGPRRGRLDVLDIRTIGNDPPATPDAVCQSIQCQYERMRKDRLIRDAEWRRNEESRARVASLRAEAAAASQVAERPVDSRWVGGGVPIVARPRVTRARPVEPSASTPPAAHEPSVRLRR